MAVAALHGQQWNLDYKKYILKTERTLSMHLKYQELQYLGNYPVGKDSFISRLEAWKSCVLYFTQGLSRVTAWDSNSGGKRTPYDESRSDDRTLSRAPARASKCSPISLSKKIGVAELLFVNKATNTIASTPIVWINLYIFKKREHLEFLQWIKIVRQLRRNNSYVHFGMLNRE